MLNQIDVLDLNSGQVTPIHFDDFEVPALDPADPPELTPALPTGVNIYGGQWY